MKISIHLRCAACGGDLRGCDVFGLCAECHRPVSETIRVEALDGATLAIREDVACVGCGYNLRTLSLEAKCPECGQPVVDSLATNALHLADIKWLRRVRSGVGMLLVGDITLLVTAIFLVAFLFVQSSTSPSALNSNATQWITQIAYVVFLGAIIFSLLGNVLVASDRLQARRVAIQFFFITGIVFEFVPTGWLVRFDPLGGSTILAFQRVMFPIAQCIGIALLRRIALLGSQARLARASRVLLWALIVGCALQSYEVAFSLYFASFRGSGFGRSTGSFLSGYSAAIAAAIIFLGAFVAEVFLLIRYRRLLADAIEVAKQRAAA